MSTVPERVEEQVMIGTAGLAAGARFVGEGTMAGPIGMAMKTANFADLAYRTGTALIDRRNARVETELYLLDQRADTLAALMADRSGGEAREREIERLRAEIEVLGADLETAGDHFFRDAVTGRGDPAMAYVVAPVLGRAGVEAVLEKLGTSGVGRLIRRLTRHGAPLFRARRTVRQAIGARAWTRLELDRRIAGYSAAGGGSAGDALQRMIGRVEFDLPNIPIELSPSHLAATAPRPVRELRIESANAFQAIAAIQAVQLAAALSPPAAGPPAAAAAPQRIDPFTVVVTVTSAPGYYSGDPSTSNHFDLDNKLSYQQLLRESRYGDILR